MVPIGPLMLQIPTRPKPFPCLVINHTNSRIHLIPSESTAYVACPPCAKQHLGYFSRLPAQSKKDLEKYIPPSPPHHHLPYQLDLLTWSPNQETGPNIFLNSYMLLVNNRSFNIAERFRKHSIFAMTSQSV